MAIKKTTKALGGYSAGSGGDSKSDHFRGYFETSDEIQAILKPKAGDFAWCGTAYAPYTTANVWVYNKDTKRWDDSGVPVPDKTVLPSTESPLMDGSAQLGDSGTYSDGRHRHPSDTTKLTKSAADNNLYGAFNGGLLKVSGTPAHDIYVDSSSTQTKEDGSRYFPFKTLAGAVAAGQSGVSTTFHIASGGSYNEPLTLNNITNWTFLCEGTIGQFRSEILGLLTISGTSQRIGISGIQFKGGYTFSSSVGNIYFDNVAIQGGPINIGGSGYHLYDFCEFMTNSTFTTTGFVRLRNSSCEDNSIFTIDNANTILSLESVSNVTLWRKQGSYLQSGTTNLITVSSLSATYPLVSENTAGAVYFFGGYARNPITTALYPIQLKGTAVYNLGILEFEPSTSTLLGTRVDSGLHTLQIYDHQVFINLNPLTATQQDINKTIDIVIGVLKNDINKLNEKVQKFIVSQTPVQSIDSSPITLRCIFTRNDASFASNYIEQSDTDTFKKLFIDIRDDNGVILEEGLKFNSFEDFNTHLFQTYDQSMPIFVQLYFKKIISSNQPTLTMFNQFYSCIKGRKRLNSSKTQLHYYWDDLQNNDSASSEVVKQFLSKLFTTALNYNIVTNSKFNEATECVRLTTKLKTIGRVPNQVVVNGHEKISSNINLNGRTVFCLDTNSFETFSNDEAVDSFYEESYIARIDLDTADNMSIESWTTNLGASDFQVTSCLKVIKCKFTINSKTYIYFKVYPLTNDTFCLKNVYMDGITNPRVFMLVSDNRVKPQLRRIEFDTNSKYFNYYHLGYVGRIMINDIFIPLLASFGLNRCVRWGNRKFQFVVIGDNGYMTELTSPAIVNFNTKGLPFQIEYSK